MGDAVNMESVIFLDCTEEDMIKRIEQRAKDAGDQARSDDNLETMKKRFRVFKEQSVPIVNLYR